MIGRFLLFFFSIPTSAAPLPATFQRLAQEQQYFDGVTIEEDELDEGDEVEATDSLIIKAILELQNHDLYEEQDRQRSRPTLIAYTKKPGAQTSRETLSPYRWAAGFNLAGGSLTLDSETQPSLVTSAGGAISRNLNPWLTAGVGGDTQWRDFTGTLPLWSSQLQVVLQAQNGDSRISVNPRFSFRTFEGRPLSETPEIALSYTYGNADRYLGTSLAFGFYRSLDEQYASLNGPTQQLKLYGGVELTPRLNLDLDISVNHSESAGSGFGLGVSSAYRFSEKWSFALEMNATVETLQSIATQLYSANAQLSYLVSPDFSLYLSQSYSRNNGALPASPMGIPQELAQNELRSLVGMALKFESTN